MRMFMELECMENMGKTGGGKLNLNKMVQLIYVWVEGDRGLREYKDAGEYNELTNREYRHGGK